MDEDEELPQGRSDPTAAQSPHAENGSTAKIVILPPKTDPGNVTHPMKSSFKGEKKSDAGATSSHEPSVDSLRKNSTEILRKSTESLKNPTRRISNSYSENDLPKTVGHSHSAPKLTVRPVASADELLKQNTILAQQEKRLQQKKQREKEDKDKSVKFKKRLTDTSVFLVPFVDEGWERSKIPNLLRHAMKAVLSVVTPERVKAFRRVAPTLLAGYTVLWLLFVRFIWKQPLTQDLFKRFMSFLQQRWVRLVARRVLIMTAMSWGAFWGVVVYILKKVHQWPPPRPKRTDRAYLKLDKRPTICFSGAFFLHPFFSGVVAFVRDTYDCSDIRVTGSSGGAFQVGMMALDLDPVQFMEMTAFMYRRLADIYDGAVLLVEFDVAANFLAEEMKILGATDEKVRRAAAKNAFFTGISELQWIKIFGVPILPYLKHRVVGLPQTVKELAENLMKSGSIPPFTGSPSYFPNSTNIAMDGALSSMYAVPEDANLNHVVRITPWEWCHHDIAMPFQPWFHFWNSFFPPDAVRHGQLFCEGYTCAKEHSHIFAAAGFVDKQTTPRTMKSKNDLGLSRYTRAFENVAALATSRMKRASSSQPSHFFMRNRLTLPSIPEEPRTPKAPEDVAKNDDEDYEIPDRSASDMGTAAARKIG